MKKPTRQDYHVKIVDLDWINIKDRIRPLNDDKVAELSDSMRRVGLLHAIVVLETPDYYDLVSGLHRLSAARQLGWAEIDCVVLKCDAVDARLSEVAENLHRNELTALERAEHIAEWNRLAGVLVQLEPKPHGGRPEGGERLAARKLGIPRLQLRRSIAIDKLTPAAKKAAVEVGLSDNQQVLLEAAKAAPEDQEQSIRSHPSSFDAARTERDRAARFLADALLQSPDQLSAILAALDAGPSVKAIADYLRAGKSSQIRAV